MSKISPGDLQLTTSEQASSKIDLSGESPPRDRFSFDLSQNYHGSQSYVSRAVPTSGSDIGSDESVELYREKLEHLQILTRQLNKQLQSEKIRSEGVETLNRCLKDERTESEKLNTKLNKSENIISILQNRLATNNLPTSVDLEPGESAVSGFSIVGQSTFDSLVKENLGLKSELKYLTVDPVKMDDLSKENNTLREQLLSIQKENARLRLDKQEVSSFLSSTDDDKIHEIERLRGELTDLRQKGQSQDVLCRSLSEQSQSLKDRLRETGDLCQQLLRRLEQLEATPSDAGFRDDFVKLSLSGATKNSDHAGKTAVQDEITRLGAKLQEVVSVNQQWQEYHDRREAEYSALQARLEAQERSEDTTEVARRHQQQVDTVVMKYKQQLGAAEEERQKLSDENRALRLQLSSQAADNTRLEDKLTTVLGQLRNRPAAGASSQADKDRIQALEMQVRVCTEDFESERKDRERAHGKIADMERELQIYKSQLESFQRGAAARIEARRRAGYLQAAATHANYVQCDVTNLDNVPMPEPSPVPHLIGRGLFQADGDMDTDEGEDTVDCPPPIRRPDQHDELAGGSSTSGGPGLPGGPVIKKKKSTTLQCPQCSKVYPREQHTQLLQHMDTCLN